MGIEEKLLMLSHAMNKTVGTMELVLESLGAVVLALKSIQQMQQGLEFRVKELENK